jgi:hypothetical protein
MFLIAGLLVVMAVAAVVAVHYFFGASKPDPNSPRAACDAMHDLTAASATSWYQGRKTAGETPTQMENILAQAHHQCSTTIDSQIMTIASQMAADGIASLTATPTSSGGK